jgi:predicted dehydrogenase
MDRLRIGVIGCGEIAVRMAAAIANSRHTKHVMVTDTQAALAQDLGQQYGVPWTDRVDDLLANPAVDAVYIAVPHHFHASLTMQAAEAGKHILVEKPIAITLTDAEAMGAAMADMRSIRKNENGGSGRWKRLSAFFGHRNLPPLQPRSSRAQQ